MSNIECKVDLLSEDGLSRKYRFTVEREVKDKFVDEVIRSKQVDFSMPGFRKGKTPPSVIKKKLLGSGKDDGDKEFKSNLDQQMIDNTFWNYINSNKIKMVPGSTDMISFENEVDKDMVYEISLEVTPNIPDIKLEDSEIEIYNVEYTEEDKNSYKDEIRKSKTHIAEDGHEVLDGDLLLIDFVGKVDGEEFEGGTAKDFSLKIGSGAVIPGIEEQLIGAKLGEKRKS